MSYEVDPRRNMIDIHEETFLAKTLAKSIVQPTGRGGRVLSAVIDENPGHHRRTEAPTHASHSKSRGLPQTHAPAVNAWLRWTSRFLKGKGGRKARGRRAGASGRISHMCNQDGPMDAPGALFMRP